MTRLRVLDDQLPVVQVVLRDGTELVVAGADLSDEGTERLRDVLHESLAGCVVRVIRVARVQVIDLT